MKRSTIREVITRFLGGRGHRMHMADALVSPAVGGTMWAATAATTAYCAKRIREEADFAKIPLMGVTGAFIFAAQMLNFSIPGTGSSGHLGGGLLLAILLGPEAAFLVIASVLAVQALFFADGGLLALGCNVFNLGFFPAFIAYPLVYKRIAGAKHGRGRLVTGAILGALVGLSAGALGVVLETTASGVSELPFRTFVAMMLPIHLAIGLVEGLVTAVVVAFVSEAQPEVLVNVAERKPFAAGGVARKVLIGFAVAAVVAGGVLSRYASTNPDGLEWSVARVIRSGGSAGDAATAEEAASAQEKTAPKPATGSNTGTAGILGGVITLLVAAGTGAVLTHRARRTDS